jgi:hypothetical protein
MDIEDSPRLKVVASKAVELLDELIGAMESAADHLARGGDSGFAGTSSYELYLVPSFEGRDEGVACIMDADSCFSLLERAARECGVDLKATEELSVKPPDMEFEEGLVTGSFMAFKGISVEIDNDPLEEMLGLVVDILSSRNIYVNFDDSTDEAEVIFFLPVRRFSGQRG